MADPNGELGASMHGVQWHKQRPTGDSVFVRERLADLSVDDEKVFKRRDHTPPEFKNSDFFDPEAKMDDPSTWFPLGGGSDKKTPYGIGADILLEMLDLNQTRHIFAFIGASNYMVFEQNEKRNKDHVGHHIEMIQCRHEQFGGHMAAGYYRSDPEGKPGVLSVTSGPGAANTISATYDAWKDGTPIIVLAGQIPASWIGTDAFQEAPTVDMAKPITKWAYRVETHADLPYAVNRAFYESQVGRPGPVLLDLCKNVMNGRAPANTIFRQFHPPKVNHDLSIQAKALLDHLATLINQAERPLIVSGHGILQGGASRLLTWFYKHANIPVSQTLLGLGTVDQRDTETLPIHGQQGHPVSNYAVQVADLIVVLGAHFNDRNACNFEKFGKAAKIAAKEERGGIVHIDIEAIMLSRAVHADIGIVADVGEALLYLLQGNKIEHKPRTEWFGLIEEWFDTTKYDWIYHTSDGELHLPTVLRVIDEETCAIKDDLVVTTGVGNHQLFALQMLHFTQGKGLATSGGAGTMGYGLPAAIGAKVANPGKRVLLIDGDGSFQMSCMELASAHQRSTRKQDGYVVASGIPTNIHVVIANNSFLGMVQEAQDQLDSDTFPGTHLVNPNFGELVKAMHAEHIQLTPGDDEDAIRAKVTEFLNHTGSSIVLECVTSPFDFISPNIVSSDYGLDQMEIQTSFMQKIIDETGISKFGKKAEESIGFSMPSDLVFECLDPPEAMKQVNERFDEMFPEVAEKYGSSEAWCEKCKKKNK